MIAELAQRIQYIVDVVPPKLNLISEYNFCAKPIVNKKS
jgi:hypothetical protein